MDNKEKEINSYLKNRYAYIKAYENANVYLSSEGKETIPLKNIDPKNVKYMGIEEIKKEDGLIFEKSHFEIKLPNGEFTILTVDKDGKDMSCNFIDENGNSKKFLLTPRMQKEIISKSVNGKIQGNIDSKAIKESLFPESQEDMEKEIEKDTLIPKEAEETIKKIKKKNPNSDVKKVVEKDKDESKENEESEEKGEEIDLPESVKDKVQEVKERDGSKLKHVLIAKNPASISDQLTDNVGLKQNGEPVYCLAFRNSAVSTNDRIVFIQGSKVIDERKFDEDATEFMDNYRNTSVVHNVEDLDSKIYYTDLDGHTITADMKAEPRDLKPNQKDELADILDELDNEEEAIRGSNMTIEDKIEASQRINEKRVKAFDKYGLSVSEIRSEIRADEEIGDDIQDDIEEEKKELEEDLQEEEIDEEPEEDLPDNIDDEYDPRDPNYNGGPDRGERKKY